MGEELYESYTGSSKDARMVVVKNDDAKTMLVNRIVDSVAIATERGGR
jgi:hypothetical protein